MGGGELHLDFMPDVSWKASRFELVPTTDFNKSLLKVGVRVVLRDGQRLVTCLTRITDPKGVKVLTLEHLDKSGLWYATDYDIMEVWEGPELVADFFDMDKKGALLFKRVEKTAEYLKHDPQVLGRLDTMIFSPTLRCLPIYFRFGETTQYRGEDGTQIPRALHRYCPKPEN